MYELIKQEGSNHTLTKEAFVRQVEQARGTLYRVTFAYLRQECDRLDAVQETLLKAWQGLGRLKREEYFRTWLTRILIRECINIQRSQRRMTPTEILPDAPTPETSSNPELREAILSLPEQLRITVVLFYMEGYSVDEIAQTLRVSRGTVCSRLARARKQMKLKLEEEAVW